MLAISSIGSRKRPATRHDGRPGLVPKPQRSRRSELANRSGRDARIRARPARALDASLNDDHARKATRSRSAARRSSVRPRLSARLSTASRAAKTNGCDHATTPIAPDTTIRSASTGRPAARRRDRFRPGRTRPDRRPPDRPTRSRRRRDDRSFERAFRGRVSSTCFDWTPRVCSCFVPPMVVILQRARCARTPRPRQVEISDDEVGERVAPALTPTPGLARRASSHRRPRGVPCRREIGLSNTSRQRDLVPMRAAPRPAHSGNPGAGCAHPAAEP